MSDVSQWASELIGIAGDEGAFRLRFSGILAEYGAKYGGTPGCDAPYTKAPKDLMLNEPSRAVPPTEGHPK